jgi:transcriptional regulator GlxA family with amidase domain
MMKRLAVVVFPGFQILDLVAVSVFELANKLAPRPLYEIRVVSEQGGAVRSSAGVPVETQCWRGQRWDTVVVTGGLDVEPSSPGLRAFLRRAQGSARRVASICTGAFILAEAGLLEGRAATTHWQFARELQRRYPGIKVREDRIYITDGTVWTSAGMTAGIDLSLALAEEDIGPEASREIARKLVMYHRRAGGQAQFSALLEMEPKSDRIRSALGYARANLRKALSVEQLAEVAHLSPRQFSRAFRAETGQSPAKAIESLRVEAARLLIDEGSHAVETVARETGFEDTERMRRAFLRAFGQPPQALRRAARLHAH